MIGGEGFLFDQVGSECCLLLLEFGVCLRSSFEGLPSSASFRMSVVQNLHMVTVMFQGLIGVSSGFDWSRVQV